MNKKRISYGASESPVSTPFITQLFPLLYQDLFSVKLNSELHQNNRLKTFGIFLMPGLKSEKME